MHPSEIAPVEIEQLNQESFERVVRNLLQDRRRRLSLPPEAVRLTDKATARDGGVDVLTQAGDLEDDCLGTGEVVWQLKAQTDWPSDSKIEEELAKPKVREAFERGAGYVLVVKKNAVAADQSDRLTSLQELAAAAGCTGAVRLLCANQIADLASTAPSAVSELKPQLNEFRRVAEVLLQDQRHIGPFIADEARESIVENAIRKIEAAGGALVLIDGKSGSGRTRLALEMVNRTGGAEVALYRDGLPSSEGFFNWMAASGSVSALLVIDNCDEDCAARIKKQVDSLDGRLKVIAIVDSIPGVPRVPPMNADAIENLIRARLPDLSYEQSLWVTRVAEGYPGLALIIGQALIAGGEAAPLLADPIERSRIIRSFLGASELGELALTGIALLTFAGIEGDLAAEGAAVAEFLGIDFSQMQNALSRAYRHEVVVKRGRYRSISPEVLAIWLAHDYWSDNAYRIGDLLSRLPTDDARTRMLDRLKSIGPFPPLNQFVEERISGHASIQSLSDDGAATEFACLARLNPDFALQSLGAIVANASYEELVAFSSGRQEVLWFLEDAVSRRQTFNAAIRVVASLAMAEVDGFRGAATGIWNRVFLPILGQTQASLEERIAVLREYSDSADSEKRKLALQAIGSIVTEYESAAIHQSPDAPPSTLPPSEGEILEAKQQAFLILKRMVLNDEEPSVRETGFEVVRRHARSIAASGSATGLVDLLERVRDFVAVPDETIWELSDDLQASRSWAFAEDDRTRLKAVSDSVFGASLEDRVKRYFGVRSPSNFRERDTIDETRRSLVAECFESPNTLGKLLPWLFSEKVEFPLEFGRVLGSLDDDEYWIDELQQGAVEGVDSRILSAYLVVRGIERGSDGESWRNSLLDHWSEDRILSGIVYDATIRGPSSEHAGRRIVSLFDTTFLSIEHMSWHGATLWVAGLPVNVVKEWLERLIPFESVTATDAALRILEETSQRHGAVPPELVDSAWKAAESDLSWESLDQMTPYYWRLVADRLVVIDPVRMSRTIGRAIAGDRLSFHDERGTALVNAFELAPEGAWSVLMEEIAQEGYPYGTHYSLRELKIANSLPVEVAARWVAASSTEAVRYVAHCVNLDSDDFPEVARLLLEHDGTASSDALSETFGSGGSYSSESQFVTEKLQQINRWLTHESETVRKWAGKELLALQAWLPHARERDDEHRV
jgi:hypothetical protein